MEIKQVVSRKMPIWIRSALHAKHLRVNNEYIIADRLSGGKAKKEVIAPVIEESNEPEIEAQVFDYTKELRFGVVRKLKRADRYGCNFSFLHATREDAEHEALRLTKKHRSGFYIVEIQRITASPQIPKEG